MRLVFDTEGDGLLDEITKMHCLVTKEMDTNDVCIFRGDEYKNIRKHLNKAEELACHNLLGYDMEVFKMFYDLDYQISPDMFNGHSCTITDTLVWSRALNPDRKLPYGCPRKIYNPVTGKHDNVGPHGLMAWSYRTQGKKPIIHDWRNQSVEVYIERCFEDVETNHKAYDAMIKEMGRHKWKKPLERSKIAYYQMCEQERDGVYFDKEFAEELVVQIDKDMDELEKLVNPKLPLKILTKSNLKYPPEKQFKKDGKPSKNALKYFGSIEVFSTEIDPETEIEYDTYWSPDHHVFLPYHEPLSDKAPMDISNQGDMKKWLINDQGWKPTIYNTKDITVNSNKEKLDDNEVQEKVKEFYQEMVTSGEAGELKALYMEIGDLSNYKKAYKIIGRKKRKLPTSPKFQEMGVMCPNLEQLQGELAKKVVRWLSLRNRRSVLKTRDKTKTTGWLNNTRLGSDGRLPAGSSGITPTYRQKHRTVANIPRLSSALGKEFRSLFRATPGYRFVGFDAKGLEARVEAHYTYKYDDGEYASLLLDGDVHANNVIAFQLMTEEEVAIGQKLKAMEEEERYDQSSDLIKIYKEFTCARDGGGIHGNGAKSGKYALTYGAQAAKLASTLNKPLDLSQELYDNYWEANWALKALKDKLTEHWEDNGRKWIRGMDGSKIFIRAEHSLINYCFQSAGAIVMDTANALMMKWMRDYPEARRVIYYHDECQWEYPEELGDEFGEMIGELGHKSILKAGEYYNFNVPLGGDPALGMNWAETH